MTPTALVLGDVAAERSRQDKKFPAQKLPNGTATYWRSMADAARERCEHLSAVGALTWLDVLSEEVFEAFAETDPAALRAELIQVAAVAVRWVEALKDDAA